MKNGNSRRRLLLGGGTALGIVIFLAIVVAIQYITVRNPKRWDLTRIGEHTLAPQSKKILETFKDKKQPVEVIAFYQTLSPAAQKAKDLLDRYRDVDSELTYSFVDPDLDRAKARQYKIDSYPSLVLKAGNKEERIQTATEEAITNALARLLKTGVKKVYFLKGHGELAPDDMEENGFSIAKEQIEKQNYKTGELVLLRAEGVPDDATILIIAGPKTDPLDNEFEAIRTFLKRGGSLMVLLNPFETPKLAEFLKTYAIETHNDIVVDRMSKALGGDYLMPVITSYNASPITKGFKLASFFPEVRSVRITEKPVPNVVAKELALSSPLSWTINEQQLRSGNANFDPKTGQKGPISVMAVSTYTNYESLNKSAHDKDGQPTAKQASGTEKDAKKPSSASEEPITGPVKARLAIFGSAQFAANKFYNLSGNRDLFMNTVSWLAADENLIAIRPKERRAQPLVLTGWAAWAVMFVPVIFVPLAWIIAGVIVYLSRRRTYAA